MRFVSPLRRSLAALICLFSVASFAERVRPADLHPDADDYLHSSWGVDDGLPGTSVTSMSQDAKGFLWLGFDHSVARFDGERFTLLRALDSVTFGLVRTLIGLKDGRLAIATRGGGVVIYENGVLRPVPLRGMPTSENFVEHLIENGHDIVGLREDGLIKLVGDHFERIPNTSPEHLVDFEVAGPDSYWILSHTHLYRTDSTGAHPVEGFLPSFRAEELSLAAAPDGSLWVAVGDMGVYHRTVDGRVEHFGKAEGLTAFVNAYLFQQDGSVLLGTVHGGFRIRGGRVEHLSLGGINDKNIQAALRDREGNIFLGTYSEGLHQLRPRLVPTILNGLSMPSTWSVFEDHEGAIWVGTESGGLHRFAHGQVTNFGKEDGLTDMLVSSVYEDRAGTLWVGTLGGLFRRRGERFEAFGVEAGLPSLRAYSITETDDGTLYVGTSPGIVRKVGDRFEPVPLPDGIDKARVRFLVPDGSGGLWAGGDLGLTHLEKGGAVRSIRLPNNAVSLLFRDSYGDVWTGGPDGLNRYRDGKVQTLGRAQGLPDQSVLTMAEDLNGDYWFGTFHGILRIRREEMEDVFAGRRPRLDGFTLGTRDGMVVTECNTDSTASSTRLRDGRILVATMGGVAVVDPNLFRTKSEALGPVVTQVVYAQQTRAPQTLVPLSPSVRDIEFDYTAPTFKDPGDVTFRYRLVGYDPDWVESGTRRQAFYTHLRPGTFTFEVEARNRDGVWSTAPASAKITLLPHFYETWWFSVLVAAGVLALAAGTYFLRVRALKRRQQELMQHNAELAKALAASQEAVRLKGEFVANISHELRTPLNSIINLPEGLLEMFQAKDRAQCGACQARFELEPGDLVDAATPCPDCGKAGAMSVVTEYAFEGQYAVVVKHLKALVRSGRHLMSVINDVLDFSKLEAGKMRLQKAPLQVSELFEELSGTMEGLAAERKVGLRFAPAPDGLSLMVDRVKTAQVFLNLISNALKFSQPGAFVDVGVERDGQFAKLWVTDTGIGIAPEHHKTIFESFRQVDGSHTRKVGGTGLGLAISKELVELQGGTVELSSALGAGSTFFVRLPVEAAEAKAVEASAPAEREPAAGAGAGRPRVVVLDDEPVALETLKLILRPLDLELETLSDPRQLLASISRRPADLLIMDIMMPRLSGLTLLKQLRASPETTKTPVLVTSAYVSNRDIVLSLGAAWLSKPWQHRQLLEEVRRLLGQGAEARRA